MHKRTLLFFMVAMLSLFTGYAWAQTDPVERTWFNQEKSSKIQIYKATDGKYYGKIVWLQVPDENGKPRVDAKNPDKALQKTPILGLVILKGFKKTGDNLYEDGTVYDPKNGKTYSGRITYLGDKLDLRGYVGISLLGRTTTWTKAN
jgi:uncharacterized protein (DUF2147 family)